MASSTPPPSDLTNQSLAAEFSQFRRRFGLRNELQLRKLPAVELLEAASAMFRLLEVAAARGGPADTSMDMASPQSINTGRQSRAPGASAAVDGGDHAQEQEDNFVPVRHSASPLHRFEPNHASPKTGTVVTSHAFSPPLSLLAVPRAGGNVHHHSNGSAAAGAGAGLSSEADHPLSARSNVDPRVVNGSFIGRSVSMANSPETPCLGSSGTNNDLLDAPPLTQLTTEAIARLDRAVPALPVQPPRPASANSLNSSAKSDTSAAETKFSRASDGGDGDGIFDSVNEYLLLNEIGRGATGRVVRAAHASTGAMYAIKIIPRRLVIGQRKAVPSASLTMSSSSADIVAKDTVRFKREIRVMKRLKSKRIVRLLEVIDDEAESLVYLVMPLLDRGPLLRFDEHRRCDALAPDVAARHARDIVSGLQYLKRHRIVHRDLKPDNILLNEEDRCVLVDFGQSEWGVADDGVIDDTSSEASVATSTSLGGAVKHNLGTPAFTAPEVIQGAAPDFPSDVWSLGVILYAMIYGALPFVPSAEAGPGRKRIDLFDRILTTEPAYDDIEVDYAWNDLIQLCLVKDPSQRITLAAIRQHPALSVEGGSRSASSVGSELDYLVQDSTTTPQEFALDDVLVPVVRGGPAARAGGSAAATAGRTNYQASSGGRPSPPMHGVAHPPPAQQQQQQQHQAAAAGGEGGRQTPEHQYLKSADAATTPHIASPIYRQGGAQQIFKLSGGGGGGGNTDKTPNLQPARPPLEAIPPLHTV